MGFNFMNTQRERLHCSSSVKTQSQLIPEFFRAVGGIVRIIFTNLSMGVMSKGQTKLWGPKTNSVAGGHWYKVHDVAEIFWSDFGRIVERSWRQYVLVYIYINIYIHAFCKRFSDSETLKLSCKKQNLPHKQSHNILQCL